VLSQSLVATFNVSPMTAPSLKQLIKNDLAANICVSGPTILAIVAAPAFYFLSPTRTSYSEPAFILTSLMLFLALSVCLLPFVFWWWFRVKTVFVKGIHLNAVNTNDHSVLRHGFGLGISYSFEYDGKVIQGIATLVPNKTALDLASRQYLNIIYYPKYNLSLIEDVYI
jgi:hypothetical protein